MREFVRSKLRAVRSLSWLHVGTLCYLLALAYALPSLAYPQGGCGAIFDYVARAWLDGLWPYGDVFAHKPPGIFAINALAVLVLGANEYAIRVFEIIAVLLMGWLIGRLIPGESRSHRHVSGMAALAFAGFYYSCFYFWETAQCELWEGLFLLAAWAVLVSKWPWHRAAWIAGGLVGLASMVKFPAATVVLGLGVLCGWQGWRRRRLRGAFASCALFGIGSLGAVALITLPFVLHGCFGRMWDSLVTFNHFYLDRVSWHEAGYERFFGLQHAGVLFGVCLAVFVAALVVSAIRNDRAQLRFAALAGVLTCLALLSVVIQDKYFAYHWAILVPFVAVDTVWSVGQLVTWRPRRLAVGIATVVLVGFLFTPAVAHPPGRWCGVPYRTHLANLYRYRFGAIDRDSYLEPYRHDDLYAYRDSVMVADRVRALARPNDTLCVIGIYAPTVYTLTNLRCTSRFFSDHILVYLHSWPPSDPTLLAWRHEHQESLMRSPPTFLVTRASSDAPRRGFIASGKVYRRVSLPGHSGLILFSRRD